MTWQALGQGQFLRLFTINRPNVEVIVCRTGLHGFVNQSFADFASQHSSIVQNNRALRAFVGLQEFDRLCAGCFFFAVDFFFNESRRHAQQLAFCWNAV